MAHGNVLNSSGPNSNFKHLTGRLYHFLSSTWRHLDPLPPQEPQDRGGADAKKTIERAKQMITSPATKTSNLKARVTARQIKRHGLDVCLCEGRLLRVLI